MVTIGMNYAVIKGREKNFEGAANGVAEAMKEDPSHVKTEIFRSINDDGTYLIVSEWTSREAFQNFVRSPLFVKATNWGAEQILSRRPSHTIYES